jgi:hypothetical protein
MLHREQRIRVGDAQSLRVARALALGAQLGFDLRPRAVHQYQPDAERGEQVQIVQEAHEAGALGDQLAAEADHESAAAKGVHVGRRLAEPAHESFRIGQQAHGVATLLEISRQRV